MEPFYIGNVGFEVTAVMHNNTMRVILLYDEYVVAVMCSFRNIDHFYFDDAWAEYLYGDAVILHPEFLNYIRYDQNQQPYEGFDDVIVNCANMLGQIQEEHDPILEYDENNIIIEN
jgi:hypothetical protein